MWSEIHNRVQPHWPNWLSYAYHGRITSTICIIRRVPWHNKCYRRTTDIAYIIKRCYSRIIDTTNIIKRCYNRITNSIRHYNRINIDKDVKQANRDRDRKMALTPSKWVHRPSSGLSLPITKCPRRELNSNLVVGFCHQNCSSWRKGLNGCEL